MCFCSANVLLLLVGVSKLSYFDSQFSRIYKSATNVTMRILIQAKRMFAKKLITRYVIHSLEISGFSMTFES